jgi:hypothetical protein
MAVLWWLLGSGTELVPSVDLGTSQEDDRG